MGLAGTLLTYWVTTGVYRGSISDERPPGYRIAERSKKATVVQKLYTVRIGCRFTTVWVLLALCAAISLLYLPQIWVEVKPVPVIVVMPVTLPETWLIKGLLFIPRACVFMRDGAAYAVNWCGSLLGYVKADFNPVSVLMETNYTDGHVDLTLEEYVNASQSWTLWFMGYELRVDPYVLAYTEFKQSANVHVVQACDFAERWALALKTAAVDFGCYALAAYRAATTTQACIAWLVAVLIPLSLLRFNFRVYTLAPSWTSEILVGTKGSTHAEAMLKVPSLWRRACVLNLDASHYATMMLDHIDALDAGIYGPQEVRSGFRIGSMPLEPCESYGR